MAVGWIGKERHEGKAYTEKVTCLLERGNP
jgi:hypothetical protein